MVAGSNTIDPQLQSPLYRIPPELLDQIIAYYCFSFVRDRLEGIWSNPSHGNWREATAYPALFATCRRLRDYGATTPHTEASAIARFATTTWRTLTLQKIVASSIGPFRRQRSKIRNIFLELDPGYEPPVLVHHLHTYFPQPDSAEYVELYFSHEFAIAEPQEPAAGVDKWAKKLTEALAAQLNKWPVLKDVRLRGDFAEKLLEGMRVGLEKKISVQVIS